MVKVAIVVLADKETHADMGRIANALECVKEFKEKGDEVKLIFDGAGTRWLPELFKQDNLLHGLYESVKDKTAGACSFCAMAFGVKDAIQECKIKLLEEFEGHPSISGLVHQGYQIITF